MKRGVVTSFTATIVFVATWLATGPQLALADPLDEFGFGSRSAGLAGSNIAVVEGPDAAHDNPAGLVLGKYAAVMLGYSYGAMRLDVNGRDAEVLDAHGGSLGMALPVSITDHIRVAAGLAFYIPDQFIARIQLIPPTEPHFILLDNDPHRIVIEPAIAIQLGKYVAIGAGASLLTDARGSGITFNVGVVSGEKVGEAALDVKLPVRAAAMLGAMFNPQGRVRGGIMYRSKLSLDLALDIIANVDIAGVVTGDTIVSVRAVNYFTPQQLSAGIAADVLPDLTLTGEITWSQWSAYPSGVADLRVLVTLDVTPPLIQTDRPPANFENTLTARFGAEYTRRGTRTNWSVRGGYAYVPSPVPVQDGFTSFADNDRHILALGGGITLADWKPILTRPIELGIALQWHHLQKQLTLKDPSQFPGEAFSSGGNIFYLGTSATVSF